MINIRSDLLNGLVGIGWFICIFHPREFCVSFSGSDSDLCIYYLFTGSYFNFLHDSLRITLPTKPRLVLYSFCASLLHSLLMGLTVSCLSPHKLQLQFSCVLSVSALILLFCAAICINSVPLLRFSFHSHVQVIHLVCNLFAWSIHTVICLPTFVFSTLLLYCLFLSWYRSYWLLQLIFLCSFLCIPQVLWFLHQLNS